MIRPYGGLMWPGRLRLGMGRGPQSGDRYNPAAPESFGFAQDRLRSGCKGRSGGEDGRSSVWRLQNAPYPGKRDQ